VLYLVFGAMIGYLIQRQTATTAAMHEQMEQAITEVGRWEHPRAAEELAAARAYNSRLSLEGPVVFGDAVDPFQDDAEPVSVRDAGYQGLLNMDGDGLMARLAVPAISVDFGVYHTTSEESLNRGAGHLYGTSLPVGSPGTHAVLSAHSGRLDAPFFSRLPELRPGDVFFLQAMGQTLAYRIDRTETIAADDFTRFGAVPGEDRVTLMTCVPVGINTHRLLVSAVPHPPPAPGPGQAPPDRLSWVYPAAIGVAATIVLVVVLILINRHRHKKKRNTEQRGIPEALKNVN
jgi:sortase A